jgi:hypothetical protein
MDLTLLAAKPALTKLTLDDAEIVEQYGEPLEFYTWDRQPLDVFLKLSNNIGKDQNAVVDSLKTLVLNAEGNPVMTDGALLPIKVMVAVLAKVMDSLGK